MSVEGHLGLSLDRYDEIIRTYIPHYDELLAEAAQGLVSAAPRVRTLVDLGIGTGALSERCVQALARARHARPRLVGFDADPQMLALARRRLARRLGERLALRAADFTSAPLPRADAIVSSYALHHIRRRADKRSFYRRCAAALVPGGVLVSGDCMPASAPSLFAADLEVWYRHLARRYGRARARRIYASWADEDTYFSLADEAKMLEGAGFSVEIRWRRTPFAVIVGLKKPTFSAASDRQRAKRPRFKVRPQPLGIEPGSTSIG